MFLPLSGYRKITSAGLDCQRLGLREQSLCQGMADTVGVGVLNVLAHAIGAGMDGLSGKRISLQREAILPFRRSWA